MLGFFLFIHLGKIENWGFNLIILCLFLDAQIMLSWEFVLSFIGKILA